MKKKKKEVKVAIKQYPIGLGYLPRFGNYLQDTIFHKAMVIVRMAVIQSMHVIHQALAWDAIKTMNISRHNVTGNVCRQRYVALYSILIGVRLCYFFV